MFYLFGLHIYRAGKCVFILFAGYSSWQHVATCVITKKDISFSYYIPDPVIFTDKIEMYKLKYDTF